MPDTPPPVEAPLRRSVLWFAPWRWCAHWRPWKRRLLFAVMLLALYIEGPVINWYVFEAASRAFIPDYRVYNACVDVHNTVFFPVNYLTSHLSGVNAFYEWQYRFIDASLALIGWKFEDPLLAPPSSNSVR